jgi:hypothetical protein
MRQQIEEALTKLDEAFNRNDATASAVLYTQDADEVFGMVCRWVGFRSTSHREKVCSQLRIESQACSGARDRQRNMRGLRMEYTPIDTKGHYVVTVYVREADDWKFRMAYVN